MPVMNANAELLGQKLRQLRGNRTQQEVASAVGVSAMAISQYEAGKRIPRDAVKLGLAKLFGQSVEQIFFTD